MIQKIHEKAWSEVEAIHGLVEFLLLIFTVLLTVIQTSHNNRFEGKMSSLHFIFTSVWGKCLLPVMTR